MNIWKCFFNVIYNFAKGNSYDQTPAQTAFMTVSLLPVFNLLSIVVLIDSRLNLFLHEYKFIPFALGVIIFPINYYIFLKDKKYEQFIAESHWMHKLLTLLYAGFSIGFFYYSLFVLSESVEK